MTLLLDRRAAALEAAGATAAECAELLAYGANAFISPAALTLDDFPLPDEPFVASWETLRNQLPPLCVPEAFRIWLHPTAAGRIPVLSTSWRPDFETLVRVLTHRSSPVPPSMGATMVSRRMKGERQPTRFILASHGPYSGVPASHLGLDDETWLHLSHTIRIEHECTHYFTRRVLGRMTNALLDEVIADYAGLVSATGQFHADWLLEFMGASPIGSRSGGRLQNYRGTPPLSDGAFNVLGRLLNEAAQSVQRFDAQLPTGRTMRTRIAAVLALANATVEELTEADAVERLMAAYAGMLEGARPTGHGSSHRARSR